MSAPTENGGPAFPCVGYERSGGVGVSVMTVTGGMTLRDYFAAKAMQGFIADPSNDHLFEDVDHLARSAYLAADAMLKARSA